MIHVTGKPTWPSRRLLEERLAQAYPALEGTLIYGRSPCDKLTALERLREAGILTPEVDTEINSVLTGVNVFGEEWWARSLRHRQGRDIIQSPEVRKWHRADFWVQRIPAIRLEFRVHVVRGKAFRTGIKFPEPGAEDSIVRSDRYGWNLSYSAGRMDEVSTRELRDQVREVTVRAVAAVGVPPTQFAAVDILLTQPSEAAPQGEIYVLEVNTAPALGPETLESYVRQVGKLYKVS